MQYKKSSHEWYLLQFVQTGNIYEEWFSSNKKKRNWIVLEKKKNWKKNIDNSDFDIEFLGIHVSF